MARVTAALSEQGRLGLIVAELAGFAAQGVLRPVIDSVFPLDRITEAHRYVDEGRKRGNVVIRFA